MKSIAVFSRQRRSKKIIAQIVANEKGISVQEYRIHRRRRIERMNQYFERHPRLPKNLITKSNVMREVVIDGKPICEHPFAD